jgi:hypothetical protein
MLRCGPSNRTFVHFAAFLLAETSVCRTLLPFAATAKKLIFGRKHRQQGRKPDLRCGMHKGLLCGQSGLMRLQHDPK